jgi:hypothetical protein
VVIRSLPKEYANADDIHGRIQAQFTSDAHSIQSVRRWCQSMKQERENFRDDPRSPPIDFIDTRIMSTLEREPFHYAHSLAEVMGVSCLTMICHMQHSLGMKTSVCAGCLVS